MKDQAWNNLQSMFTSKQNVKLNWLNKISQKNMMTLVWKQYYSTKIASLMCPVVIMFLFVKNCCINIIDRLSIGLSTTTWPKQRVSCLIMCDGIWRIKCCSKTVSSSNVWLRQARQFFAIEIHTRYSMYDAIKIFWCWMFTQHTSFYLTFYVPDMNYIIHQRFFRLPLSTDPLISY